DPAAAGVVQRVELHERSPERRAAPPPGGAWRTMKKIAGIVLVALALAPPPLEGQADAEARIQAATRRVAAAGIPRSLVESRVAEGRAKGVPAERIAAAVERRAA